MPPKILKKRLQLKIADNSLPPVTRPKSVLCKHMPGPLPSSFPQEMEGIWCVCKVIPEILL